MLYLNWQISTLIGLSIAPFLFVVGLQLHPRINKASREVEKKKATWCHWSRRFFSPPSRVVKASLARIIKNDVWKRRAWSVEIAMRAMKSESQTVPLVGVIVAVGRPMVPVGFLAHGWHYWAVCSAGSLVVCYYVPGEDVQAEQELYAMTDTYWRKASRWLERSRMSSSGREVKDLPGARRAPRFKVHRVREREFRLRARYACFAGCQPQDRARARGALVGRPERGSRQKISSA